MLGLLASLLVAALAQPVPNATPARLADSVRVAVEAAVDAGDVDAAESAAALAERALALYPDDALLRHYRGYALYRAGSMTLGRDGAARARPYFDRARDVLEPLVQGPTIAESYALLASVYGMQIATARIQALAGMRLGSRSSEWMDRAVKAAPDDPRVWLLRGISAYHTPSAFGGGMDKAEQDLRRALSLFATDHPAPPLPAWGLADAHVWLAQVYARQHKRDAARAELEAARALQPRNAWITSVLLPALDRAP